MKKEILLILTLIMLFSCSPQSGQFVPDSPTGKLIGTIIVTDGAYDVNNGDTIFSDYIGRNIEAELTRQNDDTTKYNITLYKVSFSNHMPVTIDMTIPGVDIDQRGYISGNNILPIAGILGEYPKYIITNLTGKVVFTPEDKAGSLTLQMMCGKYPTSYDGIYISDN